MDAPTNRDQVWAQRAVERLLVRVLRAIASEYEARAVALRLGRR